MTTDIELRTFELRDEFHRKGIAEKAISLLTSDIDVSPMVIDGGWGTGKTEFCHKLINLMKEQADSHNIIYIDAFQADHADEPLLTVLAEVLKLIPDEDERNNVIQKIIPAVRYGLKTILKAGISHTLRQDTDEVTDGFDKEIKQAVGKAIDASVESLLKDHIKASESLKALKSTLKEIATDKPIVLFIDELDRCRPNFAVNMLEMIKHTFDVEDVNFVLITNTTQLKASINHCYGNSVDAQRYLDKFLKFTFKLPHQFKVNGHEKIQASIAHYQNLIKQNPILDAAHLIEDGPLSVIQRIIEVNQLSLREIETLVRHIEIYQSLTNNTGFTDKINFGRMLLRMFGVIVFCIKPELANAMVINRADAKELGSFLGDDKITIIDGSNPYPEPEPYQVLLAILGQECFCNADLFTPENGESEEMWENHISEYFSPGRYARVGQRSQLVVEVVDVLTLYN